METRGRLLLDAPFWLASFTWASVDSVSATRASAVARSRRKKLRLTSTRMYVNCPPTYSSAISTRLSCAWPVTA